MSFLLGLILAATAMFLWGSYLVPQKKVKTNPLIYQGFMSVGIVLANFGAIFILGLPFEFSMIGVISGLLWSAANIMFVKSVHISGVSKAPPMSSGMIIILSMVIGLTILNEAVSSIYFVLAAAGLLIAGLYLAANSVASEKTRGSPIKGLALAGMAGVIFGIYVVPMILFQLDLGTFIFSLTIGIVIGSATILAIFRPKLEKGFVQGISSGTMWSVANTSAIFSVTFIGLAVAFPLTQIAMLVAIAWGILYFKEFKAKKNTAKILLGSILMIVGAFILAFAKV